MTVSTTARSQQFVLDGGTAAFTFTFRTLYLAPTNIKCVATVGGVDTTLTYTTDYTVAVNANGVGGTVTLVSPATVGSGTLTVYRQTTNTQISDYDDFNQFPAATLENDLDIRTMVAQENAELSSRAVSLPISATGVSTELPVPSSNQLIGWNSGATALENKDITSIGAAEWATKSEAEAGTVDDVLMSPLRTAEAIAAIGGGSYTATFTTVTVTTGTAAFTHSLSTSTISVTVLDNNGKIILPDEVTATDQNTATLDVTSYIPITGTWSILVKK